MNKQVIKTKNELESNLIIKPYYHNNQFTHSIIYDVRDIVVNNDNKTVDISASTKNNVEDISSQIPIFFRDRNVIKIPEKVEYALKKHLGKYLSKIHRDRDTAKELCLLILMQLNSTNFDVLSGDNIDGWKHLHSKYLREITIAYKKIIDVLKIPTKKGAILEVNDDYEIGVKCRKYRLAEPYRAKGITEYELQTTLAKNAYKSYQLRLLQASTDNPICQNLFEFYKHIKFPTLEEIEQEADRLVKERYCNSKGKRLIRLNKQKRSNHKPEFSYVEDGIKIFKYLTNNGLLVPSVGNIISGGRVVDSLVLLPRWIRRLIKYKGTKLVECDYRCLHPNIALSIYGGNTEFLTHQIVAETLGLPVNEVKIEHLSFFNKTTHQMKESPLWKYYKSNENEMLKEVERNKHHTIDYKHRITSMRMFEREVEIMSEVIQRLNAKGIYVGYVYDSLLCHPNDSETAIEVMNKVILKHRVKTTASIKD